MAARRRLKPFRDLTPAYRRRIRAWAKQHGLPIRQVSQSPDLRRAAVGHADTPRSIRQAYRYPDIWHRYVARHAPGMAAGYHDSRQAQNDTVWALDRQGRVEVDWAEGNLETSQRGLVFPVSPDTARPGTYQRRQTFPTLTNAKEYCNVPYGPNMAIWPEQPDHYATFAAIHTV